jgi:hypothetical protein
MLKLCLLMVAILDGGQGWMILYQICVFGADLKSNMAARVHNVFSLAEFCLIFLSETTKLAY